jgi:hypothetical protein
MSMLPPKELHTQCPQCQAPMPATERFCTRCGLDREAYLAGEALSGPALASARRWILAVAVLVSFGTLILYMQLGELARQDPAIESQRLSLTAPAAAVTLCFFGLWLWSRKQPLAAAMGALVLFVILQVVNAIVEPSTLFSGVIFKALVIFVLVGAVRAGFKAQRVRAEYPRDNRSTPA